MTVAKQKIQMQQRQYETQRRREEYFARRAQLDKDGTAAKSNLYRRDAPIVWFQESGPGAKPAANIDWLLDGSHEREAKATTEKVQRQPGLHDRLIERFRASSVEVDAADLRVPSSFESLVQIHDDGGEPWVDKRIVDTQWTIRRIRIPENIARKTFPLAEANGKIVDRYKAPEEDGTDEVEAKTLNGAIVQPTGEMKAGTVFTPRVFPGRYFPNLPTNNEEKKVMKGVVEALAPTFNPLYETLPPYYDYVVFKESS